MKKLTKTQRKVANLAAQGLSNKEIAKRLYVGVGTVKFHLCNIYSALGISGRNELMCITDDASAIKNMLAFVPSKNGLISVDDVSQYVDELIQYSQQIEVTQ